MMSAQLNLAIASFAQTQRSFQAGVAVLSIGFLLSIFRPIFDFFTLTGAQLVRFEVWRLVTHCLFEKNPALFAFSIYALFRASSLFEPLWGATELARFFGVTQIISSFLIAVSSLVTYMAVRDDWFFFDVQIYGIIASSVAVLVAIKQYLPDSILLTTPVCRFKNTHLPGIAVFFSSVGAAVGIVRWVAILQMLFGIQVAWMYLRFYQVHEDGEPKGDPSDHFAWATLFPSKLQPCMNAFASTLFAILVRLHICKPVVRHIDISQLDSINIILPTSQTKEAERKRQKAIRDLTERLSRSQRDDTGNWPEMDVVEEDMESRQLESPPQQMNANIGQVESPAQQINGNKESLEFSPERSPLGPGDAKEEFEASEDRGATKPGAD